MNNLRISINILETCLSVMCCELSLFRWRWVTAYAGISHSPHFYFSLPPLPAPLESPYTDDPPAQ